MVSRVANQNAAFAIVYASMVLHIACLGLAGPATENAPFLFSTYDLIRDTYFYKTPD